MFATCLSGLDLQRFQKIVVLHWLLCLLCWHDLLDVQQGRALEQVSPRISRTKFKMVGARRSDCDTRDWLRDNSHTDRERGEHPRL